MSLMKLPQHFQTADLLLQSYRLWSLPMLNSYLRTVFITRRLASRYMQDTLEKESHVAGLWPWRAAEHANPVS